MANKDFERKKAKVGKAKPGAVNRTDTSFVARRLVVREQALSTQDKVAMHAARAGSHGAPQDAAAARSSLVAQLAPIVVQMGHHGAGQRAAAMASAARHVKAAAPADVAEALGPLLGAACRALLDREQSVRSAALGLLAGVLRHAGRGALGPFVARPVVPAVLAAVAHVDPGVRRDALKLAAHVLCGDDGVAAVGREGAARVAAAVLPAIAAAYPANAGVTPAISGAADAALRLADVYAAAAAADSATAPVQEHVVDAPRPDADVCYVALPFALSLVRARTEGAVAVAPLAEAVLVSLARWLAAVRVAGSDDEHAARRVVDGVSRLCRASGCEPGAIFHAALSPALLRRLGLVQ